MLQFYYRNRFLYQSRIVSNKMQVTYIFNAELQLVEKMKVLSHV